MLATLIRRYREIREYNNPDPMFREDTLWIIKQELKEKHRDGKRWVHPKWVPDTEADMNRWYAESYQVLCPQPTELGFAILAGFSMICTDITVLLDSVRYLLTGNKTVFFGSEYDGTEY